MLIEEASDSSNEESMNDEDLALIAKQFRKFFRPRKCEFRRPFKVAEKSKDDSSGASPKQRNKDNKDKNSQGIQCHECSRFGQIRAKCPNC